MLMPVNPFSDDMPFRTLTQCFKWKLVSSTQQLILLTLFIIRPVSSDQTKLTSSGILTRCLKGTSFIHEVIVQKHVPVRV